MLQLLVMAKQYDVLFRLLMLGDSGVGKTCMLRRFTESYFDSSHISTIGKTSDQRPKRIPSPRASSCGWNPVNVTQLIDDFLAELSEQSSVLPSFFVV